MGSVSATTTSRTLVSVADNRVVLHVRLTEDQRIAVQRIARKEDITITLAVRLLLADGLAEYDRRHDRPGADRLRD